SNFPGTSVTLTQGVGKFEGKRVRVVDTPGIYKLTPISEDERVARSVLIEEDPNVVIQVAEAKNLRRSLLFALQILEVGFPSMLVLNMWDELHNQKIDLDKLENILGIPVIYSIATEKIGIKKLKNIAVKIKDGDYEFKPYQIYYPEDIEIAIEEISALLPEADLPFSQRGFSLMLLEGDRELEKWISRKFGHERLQKILGIIKETGKKFSNPLNYIITQKREFEARQITNKVMIVQETKKSSWGEKISALSIHKIWGPIILLGILVLVFLFVGYVGAIVLVGLLEGKLFGELINPFLNTFFKSFIPSSDVGRVIIELLVGVPELGDTAFGILTVGLGWIFGLILPIIFTFFLAFAILEDSGYLSRIAVLTNQLARKMGLSGKAMIPMILGLGCGTTAHLTTRILDTRKERIIASLLVALAIPCSAQLGIMIAFISRFGILWLFIGFGMIILQLFIVGFLASRVINPGEKTSLMIELPPLRLPKLENVLIKTWKRIVWFMKEAIPIFLIGIVLISILFLTGANVILENTFKPITGRLLGLPPESANAFISAILRRDLGATFFFEEIPSLTAVQGTVGFTVLTLFIPCIASIFMIIKERGVKIGLGIIIFTFFYAIAVGALLNVILHLFV
ncbi:MAG: ferrous iron transport protein B, partial [Candidatus Helarchaeota archaeon]|nr:ferrous iron transport protein B [Candidatus Helarchaeota archaeon]